MTATSRELWTRVSGLRSWDRTAGIEQLGQDNQDRTTRTRQPGKDSQDRKAGTGELGQESQKDRQDSTAWIKDLTARTGEPG
jgi:hypothetical protein